MPPQRRNPPPRVSKGSKQTERSASPRRNTLALLASAALVLLVVVTAAVAWLGGDDRQEAVDPPMAAAGCMLKTYPDQGQQHVDSYDAEVQYNSFPPTSGTHHQVPIIWGAYAEAVPTVAEVHNLEHGGVIIHYGDKVDDATRAELRAFYDDSPDAMLLSPLPKLGAKVTLTAWTKLATCERFDEEAFAAFRSAYRGNGPERFRIGDLQPGT